MEPIVAELNCAWIKAKDKNTGYYLTNVPQYKANLRIGYQNKSIAASLTATYTGSSYIDKKNTKKLSEYTILDGNISYQFMDRFVISLSVNNILDKEYYCYGYETSSGTNKYNPAPGRTFKLGLEYSF
jgi:outer membrane receptor protein involved in Fe transport